jgi:tetratricopeptide (TPR) repeat protein
MREAEALAEWLDDDRRRGRAYVFGMAVRLVLGQLDEALVCGTRGLEIAERLEDLRLRIPAALGLECVLYQQGEYERVVGLATGNLAALPAAWVHEHFGGLVPPSIYDRVWLVASLAQLGRFDEAIPYGAEAIALAETTGHAVSVAAAYFAGATCHLHRGDWAKAHALIEDWVGVLRTGNVALWLPLAVSFSAWTLAQLGATSEALSRVREGEQLIERQAAMAVAAFRASTYQILACTCLLLGQIDNARRLGDRAAESTPSHPGHAASVLHLLGDIATHLSNSRPSAERRTIARRWPSPSHAGCGRSWRIATSVSASSSGGPASAHWPVSTSPPPQRCTARWTCDSGSSRRR